MLAALVGCGGEEAQPPPAPTRSPSELCPSLVRRLERANEEIDRLEARVAEADDPSWASRAVEDELEKATREYLKLRVRAAAQGCLTT